MTCAEDFEWDLAAGLPHLPSSSKPAIGHLASLGANLALLQWRRQSATFSKQIEILRL
jgi:hypothetical protein